VSRQWIRSVCDTQCGDCGRHLRTGDPVLLLGIPQLKRRLQRCPLCAGEAPPPLPDLVEQKPLTTSLPFIAMRALSQDPSLLPLDWKSRAANTREPGDHE
jgi:hypothetical protein